MKNNPRTPPISKGLARSGDQKLGSPQAVAESASGNGNRNLLFVLGGLALCLLIWAYFPTLQDIVTTWDSNPDYSHGYLVIPLALFFLYLRRESAPSWGQLGWSWGGLGLVVLAGILRFTSARFYIPELDGWSMLFWLAGAVWLIGGWPLLRWSWSSIAFLIFMLPLPATVELLISNPLRQIATTMGTWGLQLMAQPAIQEGTTILLENHTLDVERACSGLRMLFGVLALATAYVMIARPSRWLAIALIISVFPVALVANGVRLVITGLLFQYASDETAQHFVHDAAGWFMIPFAVLLFWIIGTILTKLTSDIARAPQQGWLRVGGWVAGVTVLLAAIVGWHAYQQPRNITTLLSRATALEGEEKWNEAALYLDRYLRAKPGDPEVTVRLAKTFDKVAADRTSRARLLKLYENAAKVAPDQLDLRLRAAALALELDRLSEVLPVTKELLAQSAKLSPVDHAEALRIQSLAMLQLARQQNPETAAQTHAEVVKQLAEAIKLNPRQLTTSLVLASTYMNDLKEPAEEERRKMADSVIENMLQANPDNPEAWYYGHLYRKSNSSENAPGDSSSAEEALDKAIALHSQPGRQPNLDILLAAGQRAVDKREIEQAEQYFASAIKAFPEDYRGYASLASSQLGSKKPDSAERALETLKTGLTKASQRETRLLLPLAALQIEMGQSADAQSTLATLQGLIPFYNEAGKKLLEIRIAQLKSASLAKSGKIGDAAADLNAVLKGKNVTPAIVADAPEELQTALGEAWSTLAGYYIQLRAYEQAAAAYENAAKTPGQLDSYLAAGNAAEQAGNFALAITNYENAIQQAQQSAGWVGLARALLYQQLALPKQKRDWTRFLAALNNGVKAQANGVALLSLRAEYEAANDNPQAALSLIKSIQQENATLPAAWETLALAQQRWGTMADAELAVAEYERLTQDPYQTALLKSELLYRAGNLEQAVAHLQTALTADQITAEQRQNLASRIAFLQIQGKDRQQGRRQLENLLSTRPEDQSLLETVARLTLEDQDWPALAKLETRLRELEGDQGTNWRYFRAHRLLAENTEDSQTTKKRLQEAEKLVSELQALRPQWYKTSELQAVLARVNGEVDASIAALQESLKQGNPNSRVAQEVVSLLLARGRYAEADEALGKIRQETANPDWLNTVSVPLLIQKEDFQGAVKLAEDWVQSHPEDASAYLRLGTAILAAGPEGEQTLKRVGDAFQKAVTLAPADVRAWTMLFSYYVALKKDPKAAEELVNSFAGQPDIEETQRKLVLAGFYEQLGDARRAVQTYLAACEQAEKETDPRLRALVFDRAARFFADRDPSYALTLARKLRLAAPDSLESSLLLLQLLADQGGKEQLAEAFNVLEDVKQKQKSTPALSRMEALLLIGRNTPADRKQALAKLEAALQSPAGISTADRIRLAALYEEEGRIFPASEQFALVANDKNAIPEQKALYVSFLLRHDEKNPGYNFKSIAEGIIEEMERKPETAFAALQLRLMWLLRTPESRQENIPQIKNAVEQYQLARIVPVTEPQQRQTLLLNLLLSLLRNDLRPLAEELTSDKNSPLPENLRALSLANAAALSGQSGNLGPAAIQFIADAVQRSAEDPEVLIAAGNLHYMRKQYPQAEAFFRRALAKQPENALAYNNLAMSLATQGRELVESEKLAAQAITLGGRQLSFLDTLSSIYMKQQKYAEAVSLLEEVTASSNAVSYALRLAQAYQQAGQTERAKEVLGRYPGILADQSGLDEEEQKLLGELKQQLKLN